MITEEKLKPLQLSHTAEYDPNTSPTKVVRKEPSALAGPSDTKKNPPPLPIQNPGYGHVTSFDFVNLEVILEAEYGKTAEPSTTMVGSRSGVGREQGRLWSAGIRPGKRGSNLVGLLPI
ncbi:hypothetical protein Bbelb_001950 [Branchiostoma belcheri]|nr:hypothetical protein Bbelb_001950 [Branchiostoma belcheri]